MEEMFKIHGIGPARIADYGEEIVGICKKNYGGEEKRSDKKLNGLPDVSITCTEGFDGSVPPVEAKKAFTHFCNATRREIKATLPEEQKKDKSLVNGKLKEKWVALEETDEGPKPWYILAKEDLSRYYKEKRLYDRVQATKSSQKVWMAQLSRDREYRGLKVLL